MGAFALLRPRQRGGGRALAGANPPPPATCTGSASRRARGAGGLGTQALEAIGGLAKSLGARYLRLYVAHENQPAMGLYRKMGFSQRPGEFGEMLEDGTRLYEYAFEKEV